jgi:hypothetical protein
MSTTATEVTSPQATDVSPAESQPARRQITDDEWREAIRALAGTDEDDVPLFGRVPA